MEPASVLTETEKSQILSTINALNFSSIKQKICRPSPNIARIWTDGGADDAIEQYKRFMCLLKAYHSVYRLVPSVEVDEIWHHHILDTRAYWKDCEQVYGFYMHHAPLTDLSGPDDTSHLLRRFEITQQLYFKAFGEYMYEVDF